MALATLVLVSANLPSAPAAAFTATNNRVVSPEMFGARGDGATDDTAALRRMLSEVTPGTTIRLTDGRTYPHHEVLRVTTPDLRLTGDATLYATDQEHSALWLDADNTTLTGIHLDGRAPTKRWYAYEQHRLRVKDHTGTTLDSITIAHAAGAGIYIEGSDHFTIRNTTVTGSKADGIHITGGSHHGQLTNPTINNPGDDGVAVVSYSADPTAVHNITINSPTVTNQTWGRGISVVGGDNITYTNATITNSAGAAIYIANEGAPYYTRNVTNVKILGATITNANTNPTIGHGAILLYAGRPGHTITNTQLHNITIRGRTGAAAGREVGVLCDGGTQRGIALRRIDVQTSRLAPLVNQCPRGAVTVTDWRLGG